MGLPEAFLEQMKDLLGEEYEAFREAENSRSFRGLRVNTSRVEAEKFEEISPFPLERIPWISNGYYLEEESRASRHPYYAGGLYYLQEPSAMTPAACLPVEKGDRVLDLCAAPGGKATELAARLQGTGLLAANDISNSRAKGLLKNLELFGAGNILTVSEEPKRLSTYFPEFFDKILVDAPCSGEGMFRRDPAMVKDWLKRGPSWYAPIQREILKQAAVMLRPGGMMLYSTCTFSLEENEGNIGRFLLENPAFCLCPLPEYEGFSPGRPEKLPEQVREELTKDVLRQLQYCVRIYPHRMKGEGHFLALLQKREGSTSLEHRSSNREEKGARGKKGVRREAGSGKQGAPKTVCPEWEAFAGPLGIAVPEEGLRLYDQKLYVLPKPLWQHSIRGLRFLRTGLYLGDVEKKRFTPSQALAMTLGRDTCQNCVDFPLSDSRVIRYLKGESLYLDECSQNLPDSGWCLVCVDGFPLGWGKLVNGQLRNKYYTGWRQQYETG